MLLWVNDENPPDMFVKCAIVDRSSRQFFDNYTVVEGFSLQNVH